jgi:hypothetical protein
MTTGETADKRRTALVMDTCGGCRHKRLARQFLEMPQGYHLRDQMLQIVPCESVQEHAGRLVPCIQPALQPPCG